jgi:hypothetical protein
MFRVDISQPLTFNQVVDKALEYFRYASENNLGRCAIVDENAVTCVYRRYDGHTCVFGAFIPDEYISEENNVGTSADEMLCTYMDAPSWMDKLEQNYSLFTNLQEIHDQGSNWLDNQFIAFDKLEELKALE